MVGTTFTYYDRAGAHRRLITKELNQDGQRIYVMQDLDNPTGRPCKAIADTIDKNFLVTKETIHPKNYRPTGATKVRRRGIQR